MVDRLEILARYQAGAAGSTADASSAGSGPATGGARLRNDPVILSDTALRSLDSAPPATPADQPETTATTLQAAISQTVNDLAWLFNVLSPPHVDSSVVMRAVAERASADATGSNPPLSLVRAWADRKGETPALYVENLDVTASGAGTVASVDRVTLTTVSPSLAQGAPAVLDVGGQATAGLAAQAGSEGGPGGALLIIRQGGRATAGNILRMRLDALLPLA